MKGIIFVCHANICRSPMAEMYMKQLVLTHKCFQEFQISSAAVSSVRAGEGIFHCAKEQLVCQGFGNNPELTQEENEYLLNELQEKKARKFTFQDYKENDLVIIMDQSNRKHLRFDIGDDVKGKVHRLLEYTEDVRDVADPWETNDFVTAYQDIVKGCQALLSKLTKQD